MRPVILKSQDLILTELKEQAGDPSTGGLWTNVNIYRALSRAIGTWAGKVVLPRLYEFPSNFDGRTWHYAVPSYIRGDIDVEIRMSFNSGMPGLEGSGDNDVMSWTTVFAGQLEPSDASGEGAVFRFHTMPYNQAGRIKWWVSNGPVPVAATLPTLNTTIDADDTTIIVNGALTVGDVGWVKLDGEYVAYADIERGATTTTLLNCQRGVFGSAPAGHTQTSCTVYWCVAVDDVRLWDHLYDQTLVYMHELKLHRGTAQDRRQHQEMVNHLQDRANSFWHIHGYVTQRMVRTELSQQALGKLPWF